ncbi:MAG TPA: transketolase [Fibrobacteres bacterium]|jgi:2-oxoisovalerate dehydrogenase E1 component|nr:transketolase [Fibrobacterota bacterium]
MTKSIPCFPKRVKKEELYPCAYWWMILSRKMDEKIEELFRKRYAKGTVTQGIGNEATAVGMGLPLRFGKDVVSIMHRDIATHLLWGTDPYKLFCQYIANADSITHGREGNVHHGDAANRKFPMISHLGDMISLVVGGTWAARKNGEDVMGLSITGDGGTSTGDFHESLNIASVRKVPVLFLIENNHYAYSVPTRLQYNCKKLSDRAASYNIPGKTIDGTDVWEVYNTVCDAFEEMNESSMPYLLECMTLRLKGHAIYDNAEYVSNEERSEWLANDPVLKARKALAGCCAFTEDKIALMEKEAADIVEESVRRALAVGRPDPARCIGTVYASTSINKKNDVFKAPKVRNINAVTMALDYILARNPESFMMGMDIGPYGSAFKTCKGLYDKFGAERIMDMPIAESAITGFALGASQTGGRPIVEYQFADFSTEATTQLGLNSGTWYFRSGCAAPVLYRLPCGGGITLGAFHSGEFDGLWSRFPGLKVFYPFTPQETFEALISGFYDPNPCVVLENKLLYAGKVGDIDFDGSLENLQRSRRYREGSDITIVGFGAANDTVATAVDTVSCKADLWNPFIVSPMDIAPIVESVNKTGRLLVVQESSEIAGLGNNIAAIVNKSCFGKLKCAVEVISAPFIPVPFALELEAVYRPDKEHVKQVIEKMIGEKK